MLLRAARWVGKSLAMQNPATCSAAALGRSLRNFGNVGCPSPDWVAQRGARSVHSARLALSSTSRGASSLRTPWRGSLRALSSAGSSASGRSVGSSSGGGTAAAANKATAAVADEELPFAVYTPGEGRGYETNCQMPRRGVARCLCKASNLSDAVCYASTSTSEAPAFPATLPPLDPSL